MKGTQLAGLIVVLMFIGALVVTKLSTSKETASPELEIVTVPASPPDTTAQREQGEADLVEHYGGSAEKQTGDADTLQESKPKPDEDNASKPLPKMLELGSVGCGPCDYMAPIIDSLSAELKGKVDVTFIDVGENPSVAEQYQIVTIPTQVFLDAEGQELFRHIGVFEKEEILAKMDELAMLE